jgi:tetratricopeptide (TPR) repeat protein
MPAILRDLRPRHRTFLWRLRACALGCGALLALWGVAMAQDSGPQAALTNGTASYKAGKYDNAVRQLTAAVNSDALNPGLAANALYLRGMAYRKLNQPSRAIADLGAAIWLGLPPSDRLSAQVNRALSYRAAGLTAEAEAEIASARKSGLNSEVDALLAESGGAADASIAAFSTEVHVEDQASAPTPPPATRTADASAQWTTSVANTPGPSVAPEKLPAPPAAGSWDTAVSPSDAAPEKPASSGNRLSRWFGSLRSSPGASGDQSAPPPPESNAAATGWTTQTQTRGEDASPPPQPRTAEATPAAPPPAASSGYRLQLTASRSEDEAKQLWQQVLDQHKELAGREPLIEKTEIGNLGTFYRLQIGPFPDKAESLKLCNALKQSGVDCFLVMR